jgi:hypothetical protein
VQGGGGEGGGNASDSGGSAGFSLRIMESKEKEPLYLRLVNLGWLFLMIAVVLLVADLVFTIELIRFQ